jgi:hypothetical protein
MMDPYALQQRSEGRALLKDGLSDFVGGMPSDGSQHLAGYIDHGSRSHGIQLSHPIQPASK